MATDTQTTFALSSAGLERQRGIDLWLRTWIALGIVVAVTVIGYLIFISSSLAGINTHLQAARSAVVDVNGNTKTLPGQISTVNENLTSIDEALKPIPSHATDIRDNLASVQGHGVAIDGSLSHTNGQLAGAAKDLAVTTPLLNNITTQLSDTSQLLTSILSSTSAIDDNLLILQGDGASGVGKTDATVASIVRTLTPTGAGLDDILSGLKSVNVHLYDVCRSVPVNLLHGRQPC
ncbi:MULTISPECIES: hypothetical protein [unclassified Nocardioides]|uniref:hypothetical protein n=1 Tax=unclassified Nocardioides TaxID=2615069 RepID=UPI0006F69EC4|nr:MULTISPECIES: hypothetical protein [unclassified Nocardioides]KRA27229.1 hypothetical protein ASD81_24370 [Nocardioides sp. Root614]KRA91105.1 hypothetical protein ASD84_00070 [Nocardioides sp. Root682]